MPLVQIKGVGGYLNLEQKQEIIRKVTDAVDSVEGEALRPVTWVTIEDVEPGAWGIGGSP
ncbi:MAG: tautomerase family protein, partial [Kiritimatiellales bacterium]|nr:tautomerase family protein [Kiritimatiellales bacterium]